MNKKFNSYYGFTSSWLTLLALLTFPCFASEKSPEKDDFQVAHRSASDHSIQKQDDCDEEDYPTNLPVWTLLKDMNKSDEHRNSAKSLIPSQLLSTAQALVNQGNSNAVHYLKALICNPEYHHMFRDRAATHYVQSGLDIMRINGGIPNENQNAPKILKAIKRCAAILVRKKSACPTDRAAATMFLGLFNSPVFGFDIFNTRIKSSFQFPVKAVQYLQEALEFPELALNYKVCALNELGALYLNNHMGNEKEVFLKSLGFYKAIDLDKTLPIDDRLNACLNQTLALQSLQKPLETFQERKRLIRSVKEHPEISSKLFKKATIYSTHLILEKYDNVFDRKISKSMLIAVITELEELVDDSSLENEIMQLRDYAYATAMTYLIFYYDCPPKYLEKSLIMLCRIIINEQQQNTTLWANSVIGIATAISKTQNNQHKLLGKKNISVLLDEVINNSEITQRDRSQAKSLKALLTAKGLIRAKAKDKDQIFDALTEALQDPLVPAHVRLNALIAFSQEVQKFYPKYNPRIKQVIAYLKHVLEEEKDLLIRQKIEFILLQYYFAYEKCDINDEEAKNYALKLSGPDVPSNLCMKEFLEEKVESGALETPEFTLNLPTLLPEKEVSLPTVVPEFVHDEENEEPLPLLQPPVKTPEISVPRFSIFPTPSQQKKPNNVVRYDPLKEGDEKGFKEQRNREQAESLLARLQSRRGKVTQSEVTNMLRRLDYTFEPNQDEGLTIHLGHKGRGNKKGAPGRLKGGARRDTANVLEDALNKGSKKN
jgi:hypothetical protein